jgi:hypothetical protein
MYALFENSKAIAVAKEMLALETMAKVSTLRSIKRIHRGEAIYWYKRGAAYARTPFMREHIDVEARKAWPNTAVRSYAWTSEELNYADEIGERAYDGC